jgi:type VI secretion system secreted protein VgrG
MADYKQADRPLTATTPLGADVLLLRGFSGREALSQLFSFQLDCYVDNKKDSSVVFDTILGGDVTIHVALPGGAKRHFNGICNRFSQGERDATFTSYSVQVVPKLWMLSRKAQSRIFQHMKVPDILKKVLVGFEVEYDLKGVFNERNYCVQYRESDFNFACRLMEEEGIYYFFKHSDGSHQMFVANSPDGHVDVPGKTKITYEDIETGPRDDDRIIDWEKAQEIRSGKYTLWDHSFELPHQHLEADKKIQETVTVGKVSHKLQVGGNDKFEIYDWPGEYAQRYDGVDKGGGDRPADLQKIFDDNKRTVAIRIQQEGVQSLLIRGKSNCRQMTSGHKFSLDRHFSGEGGPYVLTSVSHSGYGVGDFRAGFTGEFHYTNDFECIPLGLPYRTPQTTPKPVVQGSQTAVVVGPPGEEIFTDKYSRVKVQFHWDREGKKDADSSCWLRVATAWAGKRWGIIYIPRIGQEVLVDFLEGDPDQPIIIGSVYNADMMPPATLPAHKTASGIKTRSTPGGDPETYNEIAFEDKKGSELLYLRAEKDMTTAVENDEAHWVGHDRDKTVDKDERVIIGGSRTESVGGNESITIGGNRTEAVAKDETITINGNETMSIIKNELHAVTLGRQTGIGEDDTLTVGGSLRIFVADSLLIECGASSLNMKKDGTISLEGTRVSIMGESEATLSAPQASVFGGTTAEVSGKSVKVNADIDLSLSGKMTSIEGVTTMDVKGLATTVSATAMGTFKGALVSVQGSAITSISGAIVKIN